MTGQQRQQASQQAVDRMPKAGEVIVDRYRLVEQIATGGMGVIMLAEQLSMERNVAVKLLHPHMAEDPDTVRRFQREVELAKQLAHPNVIQVFDVGRTDRDVLFLVMEYLDGQELKETLRTDAPLTMGRAVDIITQTLDGLAEAHDHGVIHRDLKPSNIFLLTKRRGDHVKLLDFGIAKSLESDNTALTKTGQLCGTANYMPPETFLQSSPGPAGDVYAAGLILLEMLTGRRTVAGDSMPETVMLHLKKPIELPESIANSPLAEVIKSATAKHPGDRYTDADAMLDALERVEPHLDKEYRLSTQQIPSAASHQDLGKFDAKASLSVLRDQQSHEIGRQDSAPPQTPSPEAPSTGVQTSDLPPADQSLDAEATEFIEDLADGTSNERSARADASPTSPGSKTTRTRGITGWLERTIPGGTTTVAVTMFVAVAMAAGTVAFFYLSGDLPGGETSATANVAKSVNIELETSPAGARVLNNGTLLGKTPLTKSISRGQSSQTWTIKKRGFAQRTLQVTPDSNQTYSFDLERNDGGDQSDTETQKVQVFEPKGLTVPDEGPTQAEEPTSESATDRRERTESEMAGTASDDSGEKSSEPEPSEPDRRPEPTSKPEKASTPAASSDTDDKEPASEPEESTSQPDDAASEPTDSLDQLFEKNKLESN